MGKAGSTPGARHVANLGSKQPVPSLSCCWWSPFDWSSRSQTKATANLELDLSLSLLAPVDDFIS